jgi:hypothetical protein
LEQKMNAEQKQARPFSRYWFLLHADELYALTRFAYFAFLQNAALRNAHHAIEYYLKAGLAEEISLEELKRLGHNLSKLHRRFCGVVSPIPVNEDEIDHLGHFDELRYPNEDSFTHTCWGLPFTEFFSRFEPSLRQSVACFSMKDIDRIVFHIRKAIVLPEEWKMIVVTPEHATFLYRDNLYFHQPTSREEETEPPIGGSTGRETATDDP